MQTGTGREQGRNITGNVPREGTHDEEDTRTTHPSLARKEHHTSRSTEESVATKTRMHSNTSGKDSNSKRGNDSNDDNIATVTTTVMVTEKIAVTLRTTLTMTGGKNLLYTRKPGTNQRRRGSHCWKTRDQGTLQYIHSNTTDPHKTTATATRTV